MYVLIAILVIILVIFFSRNLFLMLFSMENYKIHKKRMKQLQFNRKEDMDVAELVDKVTKPVITHVFPHIRPRKLEELEVDLRFAKWDKFFTPVQYRALNLLLKVVGVVALILFSKESLFIGIIWFVLGFFAMDYLLRNSIKNRKEALLRDFPDFIRITEGYLTANIPFVQAVEESIKYVGDEWKPILKNFVVECEIKSVEEALDNLKKEVNIFETREFVALVKLTLSQGGDAKDSFTAQADKIRQMLIDQMEMKINKRKMMSTVLQAPLLLCNMLVIGLPTIDSMLNFSSM